MPASGTFAVTMGFSFEPDTFTVERSAAPVRRPRSDGLIGVASTRTTTSSGPGSGVGTLNRDISSSPLDLISERNCNPVLPSLITPSLSLFCGSAPEGFQRRSPSIFRLLAQFLLDPQQLVIFCRAVGSRKRSRLDLAAVGRDRKIGDGGILGLARAMRHDRCVASLIGQLDRCERLGKGANLVDLDEDRVGATVLDAVGKPFHIGNEEIIADQLALAANQVGEFLPAIHVVFR